MGLFNYGPMGGGAAAGMANGIQQGYDFVEKMRDKKQMRKMREQEYVMRSQRMMEEMLQQNLKATSLRALAQQAGATELTPFLQQHQQALQKLNSQVTSLIGQHSKGFIEEYLKTQPKDRDGMLIKAQTDPNLAQALMIQNPKTIRPLSPESKVDMQQAHEYYSKYPDPLLALADPATQKQHITKQMKERNLISADGHVVHVPSLAIGMGVGAMFYPAVKPHVLSDGMKFKGDPMSLNDKTMFMGGPITPHTDPLISKYETKFKGDPMSLRHDDKMKLEANTSAVDPTSLVSKHETKGGDYASVSHSRGDHGGTSYGKYQFATNTGSAKAFVRQSPFADEFRGLTPGTSAFSAKWKELATNPTTAKQFAQAQEDYIRNSSLQPMLDKVGWKFDSLSPAMQNVVYSMATQHGPSGGAHVLKKALQRVGPNASEEELINAIYDERGKRCSNGTLCYFKSSASNIQQSIANRFVEERQEALALMGKQPQSYLDHPYNANAIDKWDLYRQLAGIRDTRTPAMHELDYIAQRLGPEATTRDVLNTYTQWQQARRAPTSSNRHLFEWEARVQAYNTMIGDKVAQGEIAPEEAEILKERNLRRTLSAQNLGTNYNADMARVDFTDTARQLWPKVAQDPTTAKGPVLEALYRAEQMSKHRPDKQLVSRLDNMVQFTDRANRIAHEIETKGADAFNRGGLKGYKQYIATRFPEAAHGLDKLGSAIKGMFSHTSEIPTDQFLRVLDNTIGLNSELGMLVSDYLRMQSGTAVTEYEYNRLVGDVLSGIASQDPTVTSRALKTFAQEMGGQARYIADKLGSEGNAGYTAAKSLNRLYNAYRKYGYTMPDVVKTSIDAAQYSKPVQAAPVGTDAHAQANALPITAVFKNPKHIAAVKRLKDGGVIKAADGTIYIKNGDMVIPRSE